MTEPSILNSPVSVGMFIAFAIIGLLSVWLYVSSRRDVEMRILQQAVNELNEMGKHHDERIKIAENTLIQVLALQTSMKEHLDGIDRRHESADDGARRRL